MNTTRYYRFLFTLLGGLLILLLAACGSSTPPTTGGATPTTNGSGTAVQGQTPGTTPPTGSTTATVPPTQTSCPASGTARTAVMTSLTLGNHPNLVYIVNEYQGHTATFGTLKRYDVTTGGKAEVVKLPGVSISGAQVSADGQWIAFFAGVEGAQKLQLVRMDGQELQTLYCGSNVQSLQWSANQKLIAFVNYQNNSSDIYLLNVQNGSLQRVFHPGSMINEGLDGYHLQSWLDATHLYLLNQPLDQPADTLSILDITRGTDQDSNALQQVYKVAPPASPFSTFCWDSDSSYDGASLFISGCRNASPYSGITQGPSSILVEPAKGGSQHTIFNSSTMAITSIRAISKTTLLFVVANNGTGADTSKNGLWKINTDGTGLTQLTTAGAGVSGGPSALSPYTQYPWSNVSRDGSMFALQHNTANGQTQSLLVGPINGGTPTTFASISDGTQMSIVGWTTM